MPSLTYPWHLWIRNSEGYISTHFHIFHFFMRGLVTAFLRPKNHSILLIRLVVHILCWIWTVWLLAVHLFDPDLMTVPSLMINFFLWAFSSFRGLSALWHSPCRSLCHDEMYVVWLEIIQSSSLCKVVLLLVHRLLMGLQTCNG